MNNRTYNIDGIELPVASTIVDKFQLKQYIAHLHNRRKYLTNLQKIGTLTHAADASLADIADICPVYEERYKYLVQLGKTDAGERKRVRDEEASLRRELRREACQKMHEDWIRDRDERIRKKTILETEMADLDALLAQKKTVCDQRMKELEREMGVDVLKSDKTILQKKIAQLNKGPLACPHLHTTTSNDPNPPYRFYRFAHIITCNLCGFETKECELGCEG